jgi:hypothetical protein
MKRNLVAHAIWRLQAGGSTFFDTKKLIAPQPRQILKFCDYHQTASTQGEVLGWWLKGKKSSGESKEGLCIDSVYTTNSA